MPCVSLQRKLPKFQEESSDLETQLLELGFLCENSDAADPDSLLESETFTTVTAYDALNRATSIKTPHNADIPASEILPSYNEASLLDAVNVKLRGSSTATNFVQNIDYDAKGQRERIQYGNGSTTGYTYDEKTFRLKRLLTTRNNGADVLQDLNYTYDAAGNITQIDDNAQQTIFFDGSVVSPSQKFEYDALYKLIRATGREHASVNADSELEAEGYNAALISPQDGTAMRNYAREWRYDSVGNILSIIHQANGNAWTRTNAYATDSNRLIGTTVGSASASFSYNAHGSMASMPHLSAMDWNFAEKLCHITRGTTEAYYNYDGNGIRTRKVVKKNGVVETRLYLGGFEIWRKSVNGTLETERETLHVMDDKRRVALVETLTVENGNNVANPVPVQRYQLDNHLGSASLELDDSANIISYEEYYPYGDTSYRAGRNASEVSQKRYRYTGKEKDEESSLYYCEQRYYAAHISRWVSTDPTWLADGINLYAYVNGNPVSGVDPSGTQTVDEDLVNSAANGDDRLYDFKGVFVKGKGPKIANGGGNVGNSQGEQNEIASVRSSSSNSEMISASSSMAPSEKNISSSYESNFGDCRYSSQSSEIKIISRIEWRAKEPILENGRLWNLVKGDLGDYYHSIVVHHSGNEHNSMTIQKLQYIEQHAGGYADIPYHFAIDVSGNIYEGRPINIVGSHVYEANTGKIGIVLMTDLDTENEGLDFPENVIESFLGNGELTEEMEKSLENLVTYLNEIYGIDTLGGHEEFIENRYCPGNLGMEVVNRLRDKLNMNKPQLQK
jgi:RHS repeat-associated protein